MYIVLDFLQIIEFKRSDLFFILFFGGLNAVGFYDRTIKQREKNEYLKKSGRTEEDLKRIEFVKTWEADRLVGRTRYSLQNGGVVMGMMLIVPLSFIALITTSLSGTFPSINAVIAFLLLLIPLCYLSGALIYLIRWNSKETKFKKLTGESYLAG
ncbi:hypothetical protein LT679_06855 [Mucilaginibacter roseus]|uniref:Uncharacterized protein n=1 Tax=Mucilaginibacter roseus TaxID=1528868 RepID=A0ABS8U470_9SPHI|nr:hypothetical protein [Mucilaginibacter roseus]MCD8740318.1 hypothetical protein [Mucilaginibacter roseus]